MQRGGGLKNKVKGFFRKTFKNSKAGKAESSSSVKHETPGFKMNPKLVENPLYAGVKTGEPLYATVAETAFPTKTSTTYAQPNPGNNLHYTTSGTFYSILTNKPPENATSQQHKPLTPDNLKSENSRKAITALKKAYIKNPLAIKTSSGKGTSFYNMKKMKNYLQNERFDDNKLINKLTSDISQKGLSAVSQEANLGFNKHNYRSARNFNNEKFIQSMPSERQKIIRKYINNPQSYLNAQDKKSTQLNKYISNSSVNNKSKSRLIAELIKIGKNKRASGQRVSLSRKNVGNAIARVNRIREIRTKHGITNVSRKPISSQNGIYQEVEQVYSELPRTTNQKTHKNGYMEVAGTQETNQTNGYMIVEGVNPLVNAGKKETSEYMEIKPEEQPEYLNILPTPPPPPLKTRSNQSKTAPMSREDFYSELAQRSPGSKRTYEDYLRERK